MRRQLNPIQYAIHLQDNQMGRNPSNLNGYYESLRNNVITLLEHVRMPKANGNNIANAVTSAEGVATHEHVDSYLSKLQSLCSTDGYGMANDDNRPIYNTMRSTLQEFTVLPTPI